MIYVTFEIRIGSADEETEGWEKRLGDLVKDPTDFIKSAVADDNYDIGEVNVQIVNDEDDSSK